MKPVTVKFHSYDQAVTEASDLNGTWKKALFHRKLQQAIIDLNRYRCADLTIIDAGIGLPEYHLGGPVCNPPVGKIVAGFDPSATDRIAAGLLGLNWQTIPHLAATINQQAADLTLKFG